MRQQEMRKLVFVQLFSLVCLIVQDNLNLCFFVVVADAEPTPVVNQTTVTTIPILSNTTSRSPMTNTLTTTSSACSSSSSFRCQLPSQPTCGGCLNYQPCSTQG